MSSKNKSIKPTKSNTAILVEQLNYTELSILLLIFVIVLFIWESPIIFPIKFFVILLHEIAHAITTILTGGEVKNIYIDFNLAGITESIGGYFPLIASAGYFGSLITGLFIIISAYNVKVCKYFCYSLSLIILLTTTNLLHGEIQIFLGLCFTIFFLFVPKNFNKSFIKFVLKFLGIVSCFYVITDIKQDLLTTTIRETDSQILENITGIPAILIGLLWFCISILAIFFTTKYILNFKK